MKISDIILREEYDPIDQKFSAEFLQTLDDYMENGFIELNEFLRTGKGGSDNIKKSIELFDQEMPKLEHSYYVYRGMDIESWSDIRPETDFRHNDKISFGGYVSTTEEESEVPEIVGWTSFWNTSKNDPDIYIMFGIETKPGVKGIYTLDFGQYQYSNPSYNLSGTEFELILNRDAKFAVIDKEKQDENPYSSHPESEFWKVELMQVE